MTDSPRRDVPAEPSPPSAVVGEDAPDTVTFRVTHPIPPMPGLSGMTVVYEAAMKREDQINQVARIFEVPREMLDKPARKRRRFRWAGQFFGWRLGRLNGFCQWDLRQWYAGLYVSRDGFDLHVPCLTWVVMW
jgi:hypothetical protein